MLQPLSESHMTAKSALKELKEYMKFLCPPETMPSPGQSASFNLPERPYFSKEQRATRDKWLHYLTWEEKNPLQFELQSVDGGGKEYSTRMRGVYRKALVKMRFYGEIWYVSIFGGFCFEGGADAWMCLCRFRWFTWNNSLERKPDDSIALLLQGIEADPLRCVF